MRTDEKTHRGEGEKREQHVCVAPPSLITHKSLRKKKKKERDEGFRNFHLDVCAHARSKFIEDRVPICQTSSSSISIFPIARGSV